MSTTITPTEQNIEINVNNDVIDINVTNEIVDVNATTQQIDINIAGAYPLPSSVFSVFGRVGDVVATEGDYTLTQLGDVTLTSPSNGQVLKYNGTAWVNGTDAGGITSIATTSPITGGTITSTGTIGITQATTSTDGFLSSTDWNTFNNKQAAGNYVTLDTFQTITASKTFSVGLSLASAGGTNQITSFVNTDSIHSGSAGSNILGFNNSNNIYFGKGLDNGGVISWNNSAVRYYALPNADGTIALTSDIPSLIGYVPYTGASANVDLGTFDLTADIINLNQLKAVGSGGLNIYSNSGTHIALMGGGGGAGTTFYGGIIGVSASFTSNGSSDTFGITHSSGSGIALNITKGGSGEGLYINKTSGSGNAATIIGTLNATTLVKSGGTSSQYLMADGSTSTLTNPITGTGTSGQVSFWNGTNTQTGDNGLFWNDTNKRLGVGTTTPSQSLEVTGTGRFTTDIQVGADISFFTAGGRINAPFNGVIGLYNATKSDFQRLLFGGGTNAFPAIKRSGASLHIILANDTGLAPLASSNVLINTTTDAGFRLDVNGTARVQGQLTTTADASINGVPLGIGGGSLTSNIRFGFNAFISNVSGTNNIALGQRALRTSTAGQNNIGIGVEALDALTSGSANISIGSSSGRSIVDLSALNTSNSSIFIGFSANPNGQSQTNQIVIGNSVFGLGSNTTSIGNASTVTTAIYGDLLIGTTTALASTKLTVSGSETASSAIARGGLINTTLVAAANNDVLVGLDINPTFTNGAFTGVANTSLRIIRNNPNGLLLDAQVTGSSPGTIAQFGNASSSGGNNQLRVYTNAIAVVLGADAATSWVGSAANDLRITTNTSTERIRVFNSSGNVGINVSGTDAGFRLDVNGTARVQGNTTITDGTNTISISPSSSGSGIAINQARPGLILNRSGTNFCQIYDFSNDGTFIALKGLGNFGGTGVKLFANNDSAKDITLFKSGNVNIGGNLTDQNAKFYIGGSVTASSLLARGQALNTTLVASANNDVLVGLDISPTYSNGAFTGVSNLALRVTGNATISGTISIGNSVATGVSVMSTHKVSILIGGVQYYLLASNV
jgi:hypothetical protein